MSTKISASELTKVAKLARLGLTQSEAVSLTNDIEKIVEYFEMIKNLDLQKVEPMTHAVAISLPLRPDLLKAVKCATEMLPYQKHHHFYVPPVLE
ncbi:MAG: Asp-tRNA(Asn)/Glu-tRNA(Gln) amidotransferase subunit GatC [Candidatus Latescibacteria bacterium]|nr:Asp-tRNA(Asn)/Glu-tRNA(Gln) amidotransferase subunit GatC [Candidatus Latescibacterota bacterium]